MHQLDSILNSTQNIHEVKTSIIILILAYAILLLFIFPSRTYSYSNDRMPVFVYIRYTVFVLILGIYIIINFTRIKESFNFLYSLINQTIIKVSFLSILVFLSVRLRKHVSYKIIISLEILALLIFVNIIARFDLHQIQNIFNLIKLNIGWIESLLSIFFSVIMIIIYSLTYESMKESILQPIRSETVRKQTDLLSKLSKSIPIDNEGHSMFHHIYKEIITNNLHIFIKDCNLFSNNNDEEIKMNEITIEYIEKYISKEYQLYFKKNPNYSCPDNEIYIDLYENTEEFLYITEKYANLHKELITYINDDFIPSEIKESLEKMVNKNKNNLIAIKKNLIPIQEDLEEIYENNGYISTEDILKFEKRIEHLGKNLLSYNIHIKDLIKSTFLVDDSYDSIKKHKKSW